MHNPAEKISTRQHPASAAAPRVMIAAGGTGGHVYPAIAIADALREELPETELLFVGTKDHMEWQAVPKAGYRIKGIWISGFHRRLTLKNLLFPAKLATSLVQSFRIIKKFNPDVVVSCGGYAAGPVGWVAARFGIPLVIQEQNSFPGVTNRLLGNKAARVFTAFEDAQAHFPEGVTIMAGNPTRNSLLKVDQERAHAAFDFDLEKPTMLVLGGSGGARSINEAMASHIRQLHDDMKLQIIWQCGKRYYKQLQRDVRPDAMEHLRLTDFLQEMPEAYAVADLVVSRAGALSCSELAVTGTPSILVPSPNVAGDHQTKNAASMVRNGAAELLEDDALMDSLAVLVKQLIEDPTRLAEMSRAAGELARPNAAGVIAKGIIDIAQNAHE